MPEADPLYRKPLLRLAADAAGAGRLAAPDAAATAANPACGDTVTMQLTLAPQPDGTARIGALAHETRACVLVQASAAILGAAAPGHSAGELAALAGAVAAMLKGAPPPLPPFHAYGVFDGVAAHPGRHACVLLPFKALLAALEPGEPGGQRP